MRTRLLGGLLALTSTVALASCNTNETPSTAQSIWDMLTPIYEEYKEKAISNDTELFQTVDGFEDVSIRYELATDRKEDDKGNVFTNDQDFVTVKQDDGKIFLAVTESEKYSEPVYIDLRAAIKVDDKDYNHDFTIQAEPLKTILKGSVGAVKDQYLKRHPEIDDKTEDAIVTGTLVSFDWSSSFKNGYLYLADQDGRGMYAFRAKAAAGVETDEIELGDQVTISGTLDASHGLQMSNGSITAVEKGDGTLVDPIVIDETNIDELSGNYVNAGDWVSVETAQVLADVPVVDGSSDVTVKLQMGDKELAWYISKYTNADPKSDFYDPINSLELKAGDNIALTVPWGFHGSEAQLTWSLNSSITKVA